MNEYLGSTGDFESSSSSVRLSALRNLRLKVQQNVPLPTDFASLSTFFSQLKPRLTDTSPEVMVQASLLVSDIIKVTAQSSDDAFQAQPLESSIVLVLPPLVTALGHSQQSVRKATLETLRTFLANMSNSGALITCLIKYGIENDEWRTRRESLDALTKLLTRDTGGFDQAHLVTSLISRLRDVSDTVVQQAIHALIHVKNLIGDESLLSYVKKLSGISRQLFRQYQGRIMSSSEPQPPPAPLQKKASQMSQITPDLNSLSITGSPSWTNLRSAPVQEENVRRSGSIQSLSVKALESQVPLYYGYIPEPLFKQIQNDLDWKARSLAIEDLFHLTQEIADPKLLRADIPGLISFLAKFLHDSNFKMVLTSIHIIGLVIDIVGKDIVSSLSFISSNLIVKLADNKSLIRQAAMKTFIKLMQTLDVSSVMDICMASLTSDNIRIREEIVNIASVALLTFPKTRFNFRRIVQYLYNSLKDSKPRVKFCSMEALAIISSIIGKDNVFQILEELGLDRETTQLLTLRFEDPLLASLTPEGLLQHVAGTRSNAGTPAPQVPVMLSKESSKLFLPRATSHTENPAYSSVSSSPIKDDSFMANQSSIQKPQPSIHRPPDSVNPLLANPSGNWSLQQQTQQLEGPKIPSPEMKRIRSFSETDSNVPAGLTLLPTATPQVKGKSLPKETIQRDMAVEETITKTENLPTNTSIYAPNMKINANSLSKLPKSPPLRRQSQELTQSASHIVDSPFVTSSKMRHSPPPALNPTVPENEGPLDHITTYSSPFGDSSKLAETFDSTPIKQKKTVRSSAPPDRMMSLDSEQELAEAFSPTPPRPAGTRAKSSIDGPPQLSLATKRRMEAKALGSSQATPEAQKREKEAKLRKQSETDFKEAMMQLRANAEWNELSEALVTIQKTIGARPELIQDNLHDLTMALVAQVQNLRSSVAKIAISCFNDMFIALGKSMDTDLDVTVASILKKVGESGFLVDEATKCLNTMTKHVTNTRALTALLGQADHRNSVIRQRVSILLQMVIYSLSEAQASRLLSTMRDMERLLPVLVRFLREGLSETRNAARRSLFFLAKTSDFDKVAGKILSPSQAKEVQGAIDSVRSRGDGGMVPESSISPDESELDAALSPITKPKIPTRAKASPTKMLKESRVEEFEKLYSEMRVEDWKRRMEAVESMVQMIIQRPDEFLDRHAMQRLFDVFLDRCRDGNAKVTLLALESLSKIIPILRNALDPVITLLIPVVANQMISSAGPIRKAANEAMDKLLEFTDMQLLLQSLTSILSFGANPKVKPLITEKLVEIVNSNYATKSGPIAKYIVPASVKLMSETKRDIKGANDRLLLTLNRQMGQSLLLSHTGNMTNTVRERITSLERSAR